jgi:peptidoglycan hydrolase-like protein with peptidoglycan-binding domain
VARDTVVYIQSGLVALDYDSGPVDGIAGPRTRAAVRDFQRDQGLAVTGEVSDGLAVIVELALKARARPD